jgi:hypothetical protein
MLIKIQKDKLIEILKQNQAEHAKVLEETTLVWQEKVTKELKAQLKNVKTNGKFSVNTLYGLNTPPANHTKHYDSVIKMLNITEETTLELDETNYKQFVEDRWDWTHGWVASNTAYTTTGSYSAGKLSNY